MSTKLHHGYRLPSDLDVWEFTDRLREVMNPIRDAADVSAIAAGAIRLVDHQAVFGASPPDGVRPDLTAWQRSAADWMENQRQLDPSSAFHDPHRFELSLFRDPQTGMVLALLFADRSEYRGAWEALPEVTEYAYWNNTDQPVGISDAEWTERRQTWDRIMSGPPIEHSLSFALRANPLPAFRLRKSPPDDIGQVAGVEGRALSIATNMILAAAGRHTDINAGNVVGWIRRAAHAAPELRDTLADGLLNIDNATLATAMGSLPSPPASLREKWSQVADNIGRQLIEETP